MSSKGDEGGDIRVLKEKIIKIDLIYKHISEKQQRIRYLEGKNKKILQENDVLNTKIANLQNTIEDKEKLCEKVSLEWQEKLLERDKLSKKLMRKSARLQKLFRNCMRQLRKKNACQTVLLKRPGTKKRPHAKTRKKLNNNSTKKVEMSVILEETVKFEDCEIKEALLTELDAILDMPLDTAFNLATFEEELLDMKLEPKSAVPSPLTILPSLDIIEDNASETNWKCTQTESVLDDCGVDAVCETEGLPDLNFQEEEQETIDFDSIFYEMATLPELLSPFEVDKVETASVQTQTTKSNVTRPVQTDHPTLIIKETQTPITRLVEAATQCFIESRPRPSLTAIKCSSTQTQLPRCKTIHVQTDDCPTTDTGIQTNVYAIGDKTSTNISLKTAVDVLKRSRATFTVTNGKLVHYSKRSVRSANEALMTKRIYNRLAKYVDQQFAAVAQRANQARHYRKRRNTLEELRSRELMHLINVAATPEIEYESSTESSSGYSSRQTLKNTRVGIARNGMPSVDDEMDVRVDDIFAEILDLPNMLSPMSVESDKEEHLEEVLQELTEEKEVLVEVVKEIEEVVINNKPRKQPVNRLLALRRNIKKCNAKEVRRPLTAEEVPTPIDPAVKLKKERKAVTLSYTVLPYNDCDLNLIRPEAGESLNLKDVQTDCEKSNEITECVLLNSEIDSEKDTPTYQMEDNLKLSQSIEIDRLKITKVAQTDETSTIQQVEMAPSEEQEILNPSKSLERSISYWEGLAVVEAKNLEKQDESPVVEEIDIKLLEKQVNSLDTSSNDISYLEGLAVVEAKNPEKQDESPVVEEIDISAIQPLNMYTGTYKAEDCEENVEEIKPSGVTKSASPSPRRSPRNRKLLEKQVNSLDISSNDISYLEGLAVMEAKNPEKQDESPVVEEIEISAIQPLNMYTETYKSEDCEENIEEIQPTGVTLSASPSARRSPRKRKLLEKPVSSLDTSSNDIHVLTTRSGRVIKKPRTSNEVLTKSPETKKQGLRTKTSSITSEVDLEEAPQETKAESEKVKIISDVIVTSNMLASCSNVETHPKNEKIIAESRDGDQMATAKNSQEEDEEEVEFKVVKKVAFAVVKTHLDHIVWLRGRPEACQHDMDVLKSVTAATLVNYIIQYFRYDRNDPEKPTTDTSIEPLLTIKQKVMIGILIRLSTDSPVDYVDLTMTTLEQYMLYGLLHNLDFLESIGRFYTALCRLKNHRRRARRFLVDLLFVRPKQHVYIIYTIITSWLNLFLPYISKEEAIGIDRVIAQLIVGKNSQLFGPNNDLQFTFYNLLTAYYRYPKEPERDDDLMSDLIALYMSGGDVQSEVAILILCLYSAPKWVCSKVKLIGELCKISTDETVVRDLTKLMDNIKKNIGVDYQNEI